MGCSNTKSAADVWSEKDFAKYDAIKKLWASIDIADTGYIVPKELRVSMEKQGKHVNQHSLKLAFDRVDLDHTGRISFDEFCKFNGLTITAEIRAHLDARKEAHFPDDPDVEAARRRTDGHGHLKPEERAIIEENRFLRAQSRCHRQCKDQSRVCKDDDPTVKSPTDSEISGIPF